MGKTRQWDWQRGWRAAGQGLREAARDRRFVACTLLLLAAVVALRVWAARRPYVMVKLPVPLREPLARLDKAKLAPYEFVRAFTIDSAVLNALGTDQYIHWLLMDRSAEREGSPFKYLTLFVTYYTGTPDPVPHVPDVCYLGGGYELERVTHRRITVTGPDGRTVQVPVRILEFESPTAGMVRRPLVVYTFSVNGQFRCRRNEVRTILSTPGVRHAYFSKVEVSVDLASRGATREAGIEAACRLLEKTVPVLMADHWPDWAAVVAEETSRSKTGR